MQFTMDAKRILRFGAVSCFVLVFLATGCGDSGTITSPEPGPVVKAATKPAGFGDPRIDRDSGFGEP